LGGARFDFVGQYYIGEDRPLDEFECATPGLGGLLQNVSAGNVAGHEVGSELDAAELQRHRRSDGAHEQCFREAGHAHQQRVATTENGNDHFLDNLILADDDFAEFATQLGVETAEAVDGSYILRSRLGHIVTFRTRDGRVGFK